MWLVTAEPHDGACAACGVRVDETITGSCPELSPAPLPDPADPDVAVRVRVAAFALLAVARSVVPTAAATHLKLWTLPVWRVAAALEGGPTCT